MKTLSLFVLALTALAPAAELRLGIVGTDTSHVIAFTSILNDPASKNHIQGARVVAAYKGGSPDIESSRNRVDKYAKELDEKYHVKFVDTIPELCAMVDAVLLESVDGRVHLAQARQILAARKPLFIDKPLSDSLEDAREIARVAKDAGVPWFSSSSLRFDGVAALKTATIAGAETVGPADLEPHQRVDLTWYGIHAADMLYVLMGEGCEEVSRTSTANTDVVVGRWKDGRIGILRGTRPYSHFAALAFSKPVKDQTFEFHEYTADYVPLVKEIVKFFQTGTPPVAPSETLEVIAFLDAAQRSKDAGGKPMKLR